MWPFRDHFWNLNEEQQLLSHFLSYSPTLKQAWLWRHELFLIYEPDYSPAHANRHFKVWDKKGESSDWRYFDAFLQRLDKNRRGILAYLAPRHTRGFVEGIHNELKVIRWRCFGLLAGHLLQRIQIDWQERTGFLKPRGNTIYCGWPREMPKSHA